MDPLFWAGLLALTLAGSVLVAMLAWVLFELIDQWKQ